jgi:general L-amino acid transport system substrate-binding protein
MSYLRLLLASFVFGLLSAAVVSPAEAQSTLKAVKTRGQVVCGINGHLPGFSLQNDKKEWQGFEIEFCRAVAAAALGDASKAEFVPLTATARFDALKGGKIDVLVRNTAITLSRTAGTGVHDAVLVYIDGQAVVVPKSSNITTLAGLDKKTVCILNGTPYGPRITEWFAERHLSIEPVTFETQPALYEAFFGGKCSSLTQDISALASTVVASGKAADYLMLPEIIAQDPLGAFVRDNDEEWSNIVRWTLYALQEAEAYGITSGNATTLRDSGVPRIKRLLGAERGVGEPLGLDDAWVYNMIKQVGNYSEIYERSVGGYSPLKFGRGINALWNNGGIMYPMPVR